MKLPLQQVSSLGPQTRSDGKEPSPHAVPDARLFDELIFSQRGPLPPHLLDDLSHKDRMRVRMVHLMMDGRRSLEHIRHNLALVFFHDTGSRDNASTSACDCRNNRDMTQKEKRAINTSLSTHSSKRYRRKRAISERKGNRTCNVFFVDGTH